MSDDVEKIRKAIEEAEDKASSGIVIGVLGNHRPSIMEVALLVAETHSGTIHVVDRDATDAVTLIQKAEPEAFLLSQSIEGMLKFLEHQGPSSAEKREKKRFQRANQKRHNSRKR